MSASYSRGSEIDGRDSHEQVFLIFSINILTLFIPCIVTKPGVYKADIFTPVIHNSTISCEISSIRREIDEHFLSLSLLRSVYWYFLIDVLVKLIGPIFKGQESKKEFNS